MKKTYCLSTLVPLALANSLMAHSAEVVHIHPHGDHAFLTTWLVAAAFGIAFGAHWLLKRMPQKRMHQK